MHVVPLSSTSSHARRSPHGPRVAMVAMVAIRTAVAAIRAAVAGCLLAAAPAAAQSNDRPGPITLYVGEAHVLNEPGVRRIAVGNGKVIQATALDERQVLVLPEAPGQSTLVLWGRTGPERSYVFNVLGADTARLLAEIRAMLGTGGRVSARAVGDKVLIEGSEVSEEMSARIAEIASRYPQVINLLPRIGLERMIAMDVKFVEIRRELLENIGVKWSGAAQGPSFQILGDLHRSDALRPGGAAEGTGLDVRARVPPFATSLSLLSSLGSMLNFLVQSGDAVILAEPRLSCRSGGSARFVAGGELPIPISGALGTASVGFKEYGIKFDVSPVASESGLIAARISTEISAINFEVSVKDVPGLTKRRAETDVNLRENETLVIAGLLTDESTRTMDRVAGAGELPILGPLFRSRQFRDRQTELVVFITPRFVSGGPMTPEGAALGLAPMRDPTRVLPTMPARSGGPVATGEGTQSGLIDTSRLEVSTGSAGAVGSAASAPGASDVPAPAAEHRTALPVSPAPDVGSPPVGSTSASAPTPVPDTPPWPVQAAPAARVPAWPAQPWFLPTPAHGGAATASAASQEGAQPQPQTQPPPQSQTQPQVQTQAQPQTQPPAQSRASAQPVSPPQSPASGSPSGSTASLLPAATTIPANEGIPTPVAATALPAKPRRPDFPAETETESEALGARAALARDAAGTSSEADSRTEDRGTARRYLAARERLRMVD
jgi:pilus assembly protein CpaC